MDFNRKVIIGMIHLSPDETNGDRIARAMEEIKILEEEGLDGIIVENYHGGIEDIRKLFEAYPTYFSTETKLSIGINILPNDYKEAFKLAHEFGCDFIQVDYVAGKYKNSPPIDETDFMLQKFLHPDIKVLGGVWPKYYEPETPWSLPKDIEDAKRRTHAIVVTGSGTGKETPIEKINAFRTMAKDHPIIVGAGVNSKNIVEQLKLSNGVIVGSCFKPAGKTTKKISRELVKEFMIEANKITLHKEYENYMKSITDRFMKILSDENNSIPSYKKLPNGEYEFGEYTFVDSIKEIIYPIIGRSDAKSFSERTEVEQAWAKERNKRAIEFLQKNTLTFEQWLNNVYNAS